MKVERLVISAAALLLVAPSVFGQAAECGQVYENATRSYSASSKQDTELQYFASLYCEKSGEVKSSALTASAEFKIKQIPFEFGATSDSAESKFKKFCDAMSNYSFSNLR